MFYILSAPIINPVVPASTYYAFSNNIFVVIIRGGLGIIGSFLSALMQTFIPRKYVLLVDQHKIYSILLMIGLVFLLAVCFETDAFVARTFVGQFTTGSLIAFLIFGPMIDIKNTLMLSGTFKTKFVIKLIIVIFIVCFTIEILINFLTFKVALIL